MEIILKSCEVAVERVEIFAILLHQGLLLLRDILAESNLREGPLNLLMDGGILQGLLLLAVFYRFITFLLVLIDVSLKFDVSISELVYLFLQLHDLLVCIILSSSQPAIR